MVFVPLCEVLSSGRELLFSSDPVSFILESDKYSEEPSFLIAG
jgi:hypothetical protein